MTIHYEIKEVIATHKDEVSNYLEFVKFISNALSTVNSTLSNSHDSFKVDSDLLNTFYSTSYLLFYNSIESVITKIVGFVSQKISLENKKISDFKTEIQKIWLKDTLGLNDPNIAMNKRLSSALNIVSHFSEDIFTNLNIKKSTTNLDYKEIDRLFKNMAIEYSLSTPLKNQLFSGFKDDNDHDKLKKIKDIRNKLGHGDITFKDCGKNITIDELLIISDIVFKYLEEIEKHVKHYIDNKNYLINSSKC